MAVVLSTRGLASVEPSGLGTAGERSRGGVASRDRRRNSIEITDADFAFMPGRGVALRLRCELRLSQFGIGGYAAALAIIAGELEHRQIEAVKPGQRYSGALDLDRAKVRIGLSCRLCDRPDCRRAFPPLDHRLALDPLIATATPYRFEARDGA
jgi:predicted transcriptional regulator